jgi:hypothetical protein
MQRAQTKDRRELERYVSLLAELVSYFTGGKIGSPTLLSLYTQYRGPVVPLSAICKVYFGLSYAEASRAAALDRLPVPVFRLTKSQRAPLMAHAADLARHIDAAQQSATNEWEKPQL